MSARETAYPNGSFFEVRLPQPLLDGALETMRAYGRLQSEGLVYFGGIVGSPDTVAITSLVRLGHAPQGHRVEVTPEEARWLVRTLRARDEKLIAQLHSHGGAAGHSWGDDDYATSFHTGFLSIVVPNFGRDVARLTQCALHEFDGVGFRQLSVEEVGARFRLTEPVVERLPQPGTPQKRGTTWTRFAQRAKSIAQLGR